MILYPEECKLDRPIIFDTHAHYDDERFADCLDGLMCEMFSNGVGGIITCGCDGKSSIAALDIAAKYDRVYAAVGLHPENLESGTSVEEIERLAANKKCVAIGEIGLDYHYGTARKPQIKAFEEQLILANKLSLPVIVHDRDAHADTLGLLKKHRPRGVVHCFSGSPEMAAEILKLGMYIGVGGVVTFKYARRLPDVIKMTPPERLLLETDCPYLAPEPYRGKTCHSGLIPLSAQRAAEICGTERDELLVKCAENAKKLFKIQE